MYRNDFILLELFYTFQLHYHEYEAKSAGELLSSRS